MFHLSGGGVKLATQTCGKAINLREGQGTTILNLKCTSRVDRWSYRCLQQLYHAQTHISGPAEKYNEIKADLKLRYAILRKKMCTRPKMQSVSFAIEKNGKK